MAKKFKAISLFTGAAGLDIGLEETGRFEHLACVEVVPAFAETIRRNRDAGRFANRKLVVYGGPDDGDVSKLDPKRVMRDTGIKPGELDLLVGGPPCQSFSTTGRRGTVQDPRGTLLWQYLRFIEAFKPKFFLMENVRGLMSAALRHRPIAQRPEKGGPPLAPDELPGSVVQAFLADLHEAYRVDCFEVNAVNYGAPQLRERALFIGNRYNRIVEFPEPTHGAEAYDSDSTEAQASLFGPEKRRKGLLPFATLGEALEGLHDPSPVVMDFSPRKKGFLAMIPPGGNWRCLPAEVAKESMGKAYFAKGGRSGWWRRLSFDLPCPTVVTMPNHAGTSLCHPTEVRALSLRECARVQEFPDDWEFAGKIPEQYAQVGNAVPIRLGRVAGGVLVSALEELRASKYRVGTEATPPTRLVYVKSHVRTRQWFKAGRTHVWNDGADDNVRYGPAKTDRREAAL